MLHLGVRMMSTAQVHSDTPQQNVVDSALRMYQAVVRNLIVQYKIYAVVNIYEQLVVIVYFFIVVPQTSEVSSLPQKWPENVWNPCLAKSKSFLRSSVAYPQHFIPFSKLRGNPKYLWYML